MELSEFKGDCMDDISHDRFTKHTYTKLREDKTFVA